MRIIWIHRGALLLAPLIAFSACASRTAAPVANPVADAARAQARQLAAEAAACGKDASAYRVRHPAGQKCDEVVEIGLSNSQSADSCAAAILKELPSCRQWDQTYRAMAGVDGTDAARTPAGVAMMEARELDLESGSARDSGIDETRTGD
jgi:hypothetical protein